MTNPVSNHCGSHWLNQTNIIEINFINIAAFGKLFFPNFPIEMVQKVMKENLHITFYGRSQWDYVKEVSGTQVSLREVMAMLPQMKNILCSRMNHMVISCGFCEDSDLQHNQIPILYRCNF